MWIIVILLVGAALLVFATPFGEFLYESITTDIVTEIEAGRLEVNIGDNYDAHNMINYGD
jgi:hypothetical protein